MKIVRKHKVDFPRDLLIEKQTLFRIINRLFYSVVFEALLSMYLKNSFNNTAITSGKKLFEGEKKFPKHLESSIMTYVVKKYRFKEVFLENCKIEEKKNRFFIYFIFYFLIACNITL